MGAGLCVVSQLLGQGNRAEWNRVRPYAGLRKGNAPAKVGQEHTPVTPTPRQLGRRGSADQTRAEMAATTLATQAGNECPPVLGARYREGVL
ncbi:hypothetical protein N1851_033275 [Merluccius polli]|uniref:Uncharacterized protein n=1 Tax=Merluccius polli TaxID=89951 RepID=A0AA47M1M1_MERPO|nr:hypothetical protein N1851_033275 [Merluccius polli]